MRFLIFIVFFTASLLSVAKNKVSHSKDGVVSYKVKSGESLYLIAKKYKLTVKDIQKLNPSLKDITHLKPGQLIKVPSSPNLKDSNHTNSKGKKTYDKVDSDIKPIKSNKIHVVKKGQNLYVISKLYRVKVDDLKKWNKLSGSNLKVGTKLIVGYKLDRPETRSNPSKSEVIVLDTIVNVVPPTSSSTLSTNGIEVLQTQKQLLKGFKPKTTNSLESEKGTGALMTTTLGSLENVFAAQHKSLPIGTVIRIKNLVNSKSAYAKIVGRLEDNTENKYVIVRYSLSLKQILLLKDGRCYVQIEYYK